MNIKTLEFIHELLRAEATRADEACKSARKIQYEYEENSEPDKELCDHQKKVADELWSFSLRASNALEDFEAQEW